MEKLRLELEQAKKELKNRINIPGQLQNSLEYSELQELETTLKKYILQAEHILKQNSKIQK